MKISKLLPVLCALAMGATCLTARAEDTPDQAAARIALAKKLFELDAQNPQATNAVADQSAAAPAPAVSKSTDDGMVMTPVNQPDSKAAKAKAKAEKAAAKAKAKQEADQAAADLKAKKEADKKLAAQQAADAKAAKMQAEAEQAAADLKAKNDAEKKSDAQSAATAEVAKEQAEAKPAPVAVVAPQPAKKSDANFAGKDLGMKPIAAPALPITASKEEQLQTLLVKYKADQITPEEYQKQRAEILAEP